MKKLIFLFKAVLFTTIVLGQQKIRFEIESMPSNTKSSNIYIAGSFNGWNPQDEQYRFEKNDRGNYFLTLKLNPGNYEYKLTRGSWEKVESNKDGIGVSNRKVIIVNDTLIELSIEGWEDLYKATPNFSTASKNVYIIDTAFFIPQLKRKRRIWVYLPDNYAASKKKYPVLYLHDGQNIFDNKTSFAGEWGVDEYLDSANSNQCIIVAIDNAGEKRMNEYAPYDFSPSRDASKTVHAEGELYVDFIVKTLKPFIDKKYHTLKNKTGTYIAGSSLGGLISLFAVLKYPKVFGGAGIFSPAIWISKTQLLDYINARGKRVNSKIYFYSGKQEGENTVTDMLKVFVALNKVSRSKMTSVIRDSGKHNEATWRKEFPLFYEWLLN
jgi:predicted alpha/beta superfamily hydrolase